MTPDVLTNDFEGFFIVHSTIGSTVHSRPLNSLKHCMHNHGDGAGLRWKYSIIHTAGFGGEMIYLIYQLRNIFICKILIQFTSLYINKSNDNLSHLFVPRHKVMLE